MAARLRGRQLYSKAIQYRSLYLSYVKPYLFVIFTDRPTRVMFNNRYWLPHVLRKYSSTSFKVGAKKPNGRPIAAKSFTCVTPS